MSDIIGSQAWQAVTGIIDRDLAKSHLKGYLRYALQIDPHIGQIVIRKGSGDFDINARLLSRCEVYWAWRKLRREWRLALYYRLVAKMSPEEAGRLMGVSKWAIYKYCQWGLDGMLDRIYEKMEGDENSFPKLDG